MQRVIEEIYNNIGSTVFKKKYIDSENNVLKEKLICYRNVKFRSSNEEVYFLIYDSRYDIKSEAYEFINYEKGDTSPNTKEMYTAALKLLFSFLDIFELKEERFNKQNLNAFIDFLYGVSQKGHIEYMLKTRRSPETINYYLSIYRSYFEFLGLKNSVFHEKAGNHTVKKDQGLLAHTKKQLISPYKSNQKTVKPLIVPMYINLEQFTKIILHVREHYSIREEIIIRLMFEVGLRIGEVLGLTLEDISIDSEELTYKDLSDVGRINIVNRLSDKPYQLAKSCYIPKKASDYQWHSYEDIIMQFVTPTISLHLLIEKYIEETHGDLSIKTRQNYINSAADLIDKDNAYLEKGNFYIFLNKNGEPLSQSGWNKILRNIFIATDIKIDNETRKHNLSHRFRHGYAMYLVKYRKYTRTQLKEALRHKSESTVDIYYNPTIEDKYEANKDASEVLYKLFPELLER